MKYILTDIEGTTTSISFVHEVLFPFAKKNLENFVTKNQNQPHVIQALNEMPDSTHSIEQKIKTLIHWIDTDKKEKSLKDIQGFIWEEGYTRGEIKGHLYPEVKNKLEEWKTAGITLGVYSSGSVWAQKLIFTYSEVGDIGKYFSHYFDTSIGHKRESKSYQNILSEIKMKPEDVLFLSDIKEELDAAKSCGLNTIQLVRENMILNQGHVQVKNFNEIIF
jgi:enolase-phosphatase E1